jgi:tetratricopeptide (TPR) repeat protein
MTTSPENNERIEPGTLGEFFTLYLQRQVTAQADGLGYAESNAEVAPYDTAPVQPVDPRLAWNEARGLFRAFPGLEASGGKSVPPDWPQLVQALEPVVAVPLALGNFPQLIRNPQALLVTRDLSIWRPTPRRGLGATELLTWARASTDPGSRLLAAGVLRLAQEFAVAGELLDALKVSGPWQAVLENEIAALAWQRGQHREALTHWQNQAESTPVLFNRGMASLFLGHPDLAGKLLQEAVASLPDSDSWHHLGQLYLTLAQERV